MKDKIIALSLLVIMTLNFLDVITDVSLGVPVWHIVQESVIVLLSGACAVYLIWEMHKRTQELIKVRAHLDLADSQMKNITEEMRSARRQYSELIHQQFDKWQLTEGEQQVGLLLLKGLSFREIATVRETKEKTVRQQASTIYAKSGVEGRHEFSAWFLEDFVQKNSMAGS